MKSLFKAALFSAAILFAVQSNAQTTKKDTTVGQKVGHTATKVGHATSKAAASTASAIVDKKYEGKCGPHGETVYINEHSKYYYIDKKGHRVYLKKSELMDKKM